MPIPITFTLTNAGLNAALDANANGLTISLTQIAIGSGQYAPLATRTALQTELARYPLSGGDIEPNSKTLRFSAVIESATTRQAFEVGLFTSTGVLFAVASITGANPLILITANIAFVAAFGLVVSEIPAGSVTVVTDPNAPLAVTLLAQHVAAANSHPQYTLYNVFIAAINALQEQLDMTQLAAVVTAINQAFTQLNKSLPKIGDIKSTASAMTADQFAAAQADGSVWIVYGAGRVIVGAGTYTDARSESKTLVIGDSGGEYRHVQTVAELARHKHRVMEGTSTSGGGGQTDLGPDVPYNSVATFMEETGDSQPFNIMQPYIVACQFVCVNAATPIPAIVL